MAGEPRLGTTGEFPDRKLNEEDEGRLRLASHHGMESGFGKRGSTLMGNENCLAGVKCPKCGNEDRFFIHARAEEELDGE